MTLRRFRFPGGLQSAARNTTVTIIGRAVSMTATVLFTALFSRYVGVAGFGQYAYALSLATLLGGLCGFGLDNWAIRELVHAPLESAAVIGHSLFVQWVLSTLCLGGMAIYFAFVRVDPSMLAVCVTVAAYTFLDVSSLLVISLFRAQEVMTYEAIAVVAGNAATLVVTAGGIALRVGMEGILLAVGATYALKFFVILWYAKRRCRLGAVIPHLRASLTPIRAGFPFFVTSVGNTIYVNYPRLLLAGFVALPVVGLYAAAERVVALVGVVTGILDIVIYPIFAHRVQQSREAFTYTYQQVTDFTLVIGLVIGLGVAFLLPEIIRILFGHGYQGAVPIGVLLVPSIAMSTLGYVNARAMIALHREKMMSITIAVTAVAGISLSVVLVRLYGVVGMAVTFLVTSAVGCFFYFVYVRVKLGLPAMTLRHAVFFVVAPAPFVIAGFIQRTGLIERLLAGGAMLLVLLVLCRMIGMLGWLRIFQLPVVAEDSPAPAS